MTEEHKRKLSEAQKGRIFTAEHREKLSLARKGKSPWNKGTHGVMRSWNKGRKMPEHVKAAIRNSHLGRSPWNKGIPWSAEHRRRLSDAHIGIQAGPNNPNWRGGTKSERVRVMSTARYQQWRKAVFERDGFRCFSCGERGKRMEAHHLYPWAECPRLRFALENGITLCDSCHHLISPILKGPDNIVAPAGTVFSNFVSLHG
jgi:hypothetical protein